MNFQVLIFGCSFNCFVCYLYCYVKIVHVYTLLFHSAKESSLIESFFLSLFYNCNWFNFKQFYVCCLHQSRYDTLIASARLFIDFAMFVL